MPRKHQSMEFDEVSGASSPTMISPQINNCANNSEGERIAADFVRLRNY